ncbi:MAG: flagellin [Pseudohongiellaceae bacterium]
MSIVNYNYAAHSAANVINANEKVMDKTMARIASGTKVGAGHADSGLYGLYTNMTIEGAESRTAVANLNSGLARMKLVEATGITIHKIAVRMQELAVAASNTIVPTHDRYAMDAEFGALLTEWNRLADNVSYNGVAVMTGTDLVIRMGEAGGSADMTITVEDWQPDASAANGAGIATGAVSAGSANSGGGALSLTVVAAAAPVPATMQENITTAGNANTSRVKLDNVVAYLGASVGEVAGDIKSIEYAIEATAAGAVAKEMGASLVGDTDYAVDTAKLAAQQVISQAATAILAQANARSATVLTLLK